MNETNVHNETKVFQNLQSSFTFKQLRKRTGFPIFSQSATTYFPQFLVPHGDPQQSLNCFHYRKTGERWQCLFYNRWSMQPCDFSWQRFIESTVPTIKNSRLQLPNNNSGEQVSCIFSCQRETEIIIYKFAIIFFLQIYVHNLLFK